MTLLLLLSCQDDAGVLVERLRAETVEVREEAALKLKALGAPALPALDRGSKDKDAEVAARATQIARVIRTMQILTPNLIKRMPGVEERLAKGDEHEWTRVLLAADAYRNAPEGIPVLLKADPAKEYPDLCAMNALRQPELWKRLREKRLTRDFEGTNREAWEQLSREAGLPIEVKKSLGLSRVSCDRGRKTVLEAIEEMQGSSSILLEPDRILIKGGHHGTWKDWWAEQQKKE